MLATPKLHDRRPSIPFSVGNAQFQSRLAHAFGHRISPFTVGARQNGDELLATIAGHAILNAEERFAERAGDRLKAGVASLVAVNVVELLEKIRRR